MHKNFVWPKILVLSSVNEKMSHYALHCPQFFFPASLSTSGGDEKPVQSKLHNNFISDQESFLSIFAISELTLSVADHFKVLLLS